MYIIYDLIFGLYALLYLPYLLVTKRGYDGFFMRFGFFSSDLKRKIMTQPNIWIHAVSVGEVMVLEGVMDALKKKYHGYRLIVTVTTKTGYALACRQLKTKAIVIPSPIDFSIVTGIFAALINPKMYIGVETEIWPNLYRELNRRHVPMIVINGRISDSSFGRYKAVRFLLKGILNQVQIWCMQSQEDAGKIKELGADPSRVIVTGNIKFDEHALSAAPSAVNLRGQKNELWWVAGSTHPGEEDIVLNVYNQIARDNPHWRLVIAPRHIERVPQVMQAVVQHGFHGVKLSALGDAARGGELSQKPVVVVDTIGQLRSLYSLASLVFVGKTLCVGGGHNIIEPAFYGKPIVIGPKFQNFKDIVARFKENKAIVQVDNIKAFEMTVKTLCGDPYAREVLGVAARRVVTANQGAIERSLLQMTRLLK